MYKIFEFIVTAKKSYLHKQFIHLVEVPFYVIYFSKSPALFQAYTICSKSAK